MRIPTTPFAHREAEAEEIRRQAFAVLVGSLRDYAHGGCWCIVLQALSDAYPPAVPDLPVSQEIAQFAEGYGWPSTLRAIAQAMEADEALKRDADQRR
jgi:hypothetical protein